MDDIAKRIRFLMNKDSNGKDSTHNDLMEKLELCIQDNVIIREYQYIGIKWLYSLHCHNLNGILADEMGLGNHSIDIKYLWCDFCSVS